MKRLLIFVTCVMILFSFAACGSTLNPVESGSSGEKESSVPESTFSPEDSQNNTEQDGSHDEEPSQSQPSETPPAAAQQEDESSLEVTEMTLNVDIDGRTFTATLENNSAVEAFAEMMCEAPVEIQMSDYSGFEKVGALGVSLLASNSQMTTQSGDIVLYNRNQIVIFYGSNSWSYTRLGRIEDLTGWKEALGSGSVTVTFSIK